MDNNINATPDMPMKWHKALTTWLMIVWGVVNIVVSFNYFTGNVFLQGVPSEYADQVLDTLYSMAPALEIIAIVVGVFSVAFGAFCFVTYPKLKRFEADGLKYFRILMVARIVAEIVLAIALVAAVSDIPGAGAADAVNWPSFIFSVIFSSANLVYYKKREHLFK